MQGAEVLYNMQNSVSKCGKGGLLWLFKIIGSAHKNRRMHAKFKRCLFVEKQGMRGKETFHCTVFLHSFILNHVNILPIQFFLTSI